MNEVCIQEGLVIAVFMITLFVGVIIGWLWFDKPHRRIADLTAKTQKGVDLK